MNFLKYIVLALSLMGFQVHAENYDKQCDSEFKNITFIGDNRINIEHDINEIGSCDWHQNLPKRLQSRGDFFSENFISPRNKLFVLDSTTEFSFELEIDNINNNSIVVASFQPFCKSNESFRFYLNKNQLGFSFSNKKKNNNLRLDLPSDEYKSKNFFNIKLKKISEENYMLSLHMNDIERISSIIALDSECKDLQIYFGSRTVGRYGNKEVINLTFSNINFSDNYKKETVLIENKKLKLLGYEILNSDVRAICNSGSYPTLWSSHLLDDSFPRNIIINFGGGGATLSKSGYNDSFDKRKEKLKQSSKIDLGKSSMSMDSPNEILFSNGWAVMKLDYCSGDFSMGDHIIERTFQSDIPVRGRRIVNALVELLKNKRLVNNETHLLLSGYSAGSVTISSNLDLFESLEPKTLRAIFTVWQTNSEREYVNNLFKSSNRPIDVNYFDFTHGNLAEHCQANISACLPNQNNIQRYSLDDYFIDQSENDTKIDSSFFITRYLEDSDIFRSEIENEINSAGGGISFFGNNLYHPSSKRNHVMSPITKSIGQNNIIPSEILLNWILNKGQKRYIGY